MKVYLALTLIVGLTAVVNSDSSPFIKIPPAICQLPQFVESKCASGSSPIILAGSNGINGKDGLVGLPGPKGPQGPPGDSCKKLKCLEIPKFSGIAKLKGEIRWIDHTLNVFEGLDVGTLPKPKLLKIIEIQSKKLIIDHQKIEELDLKIEDLKKKLKFSGSDLGIVDKLRKQIKEEIEKNKKKDKKIKELTEKCLMVNKQGNKDNANLKEQITKLKTKINNLNKLLKEAGTSAASLQKLHEVIKGLHENLKKKAQELQNKINTLKTELMQKDIHGKIYEANIAQLQKQLKVAHETCNNLNEHNQKIKKSYNKIKSTCEKHSKDQNNVIKKLQDNIIELKKQCNNIDVFKNKITQLEKELGKLRSGKTQGEK